MSETARNYSEDEEIDLLATEVDAVEFTDIVEQEPETTSELIVGRFAVGKVAETEDEMLVKDDEPQEKIYLPHFSTDSVKDYLHAIGQTPLLSAVEEVQLATAIEIGIYAGKRIEELTIEDPEFETSTYRRELAQVQRDGKKAYDHLMSANLRLVVSIARRYQGHDMDLLDLIQEGNLGLVRAVEKFDYTKGFKFSTYATWWVRQAVARGIADKSRASRIPVHMVEHINKMNAAFRQMTQDLQREPTTEELSLELGISVKKIENMKSYDRSPRSLNATIGQDNETEVGDLIKDERTPEPTASLEYDEFMAAMSRIVGSLPGRESDIIRRRFGLDGQSIETLESIAESYGLTVEAIRLNQRNAMMRLRKSMGKKSEDSWLREYLDL